MGRLGKKAKLLIFFMALLFIALLGGNVAIAILEIFMPFSINPIVDTFIEWVIIAAIIWWILRKWGRKTITDG